MQQIVFRLFYFIYSVKTENMQHLEEKMQSIKKIGIGKIQ